MLVPHRQAIQGITSAPPPWEMGIQELDEVFVVSWLNQVGQLVDHDVLQTSARGRQSEHFRLADAPSGERS